MKNTLIFLLTFLSLVTAKVSAQNYDNIASYSVNGTPNTGIKIKTNLPFTTGSQMPTIVIQGFSYGSLSSIGPSDQLLYSRTNA